MVPIPKIYSSKPVSGVTNVAHVILQVTFSVAQAEELCSTAES